MDTHLLPRPDTAEMLSLLPRSSEIWRAASDNVMNEARNLRMASGPGTVPPVMNSSAQ